MDHRVDQVTHHLMDIEVKQGVPLIRIAHIVLTLSLLGPVDEFDADCLSALSISCFDFFKELAWYFNLSFIWGMLLMKPFLFYFEKIIEPGIVAAHLPAVV